MAAWPPAQHPISPDFGFPKPDCAWASGNEVQSVCLTRSRGWGEMGLSISSSLFFAQDPISRLF